MRSPRCLPNWGLRLEKRRMSKMGKWIVGLAMLALLNGCGQSEELAEPTEATAPPKLTVPVATSTEAASQSDQIAVPAQPGRKLYSKQDDIAVYATPHDTASAIVTINAGHELVEISRKGGWVEIGVTRTGKVGWVWNTATSLSAIPGKKMVLPETQAFREFQTAFSRLNESVKTQSGVELFGRRTWATASSK